MKSIGLFDWDNFYSPTNAVIIEKLLDQQHTSFSNIVKIFAIDINKNIDKHNLSGNLIKKWGNQNDYLIDLCRMIYHEDYEEDINASHVHVDHTLALLIRAGDLPAEICQLPRLPKDRINFNINQHYYNEYCKYSDEPIDIVKNKINYCTQPPITLAYDEVIKHLSDNRLPASTLGDYARKKQIGVYLNVPEEYTFIPRLGGFKQSVEFFRHYNCGSPSYTKRYKNLERFKAKDVDLLFSNQSVVIRHEIQRQLYVETTDMETKFHLERCIRPFNEINRNRENILINKLYLNKTIYLQDEIDLLIACETEQASDDTIYGSIKLSPQERTSVKHAIQIETASKFQERLHITCEKYHGDLIKKFSKNKNITREKIIERIYELDAPIYYELEKEQRKVETYLRYVRDERSKHKEPEEI